MIYNYIANKTKAQLDFSIQLQKDKKVYCFIGENGVGKTQLLESMSRSLLYTHSLFQSNTKYYQQFYMKDGVHIPFLKRHFPNTTFYVATHSPLVVSATEEGEAYELIKEQNLVKAIELGNPKSWYMADIYSQAFHIDYNKEFQEEQKKIMQLTANFSKYTKEYTKTKDAISKENAENIYTELEKKA